MIEEIEEWNNKEPSRKRKRVAPVQRPSFAPRIVRGDDAGGARHVTEKNNKMFLLFFLGPRFLDSP